MSDEELRALAETASPGPWVLNEFGDVMSKRAGNSFRFVAANAHMDDWDGPCIAAVSPDVVLGLLDRLIAAEGVIAQLRRPPCWGPNENGDLMVDLEVVGYEEDLDRLLAAVRGETRNRPTRAATGPRSDAHVQSDHGHDHEPDDGRSEL